ncbi:hypothetical protein CCHL11_10395 [Colletotrichum chlorophyti]|uniref:Amidohydrolase-related domain-containing protein n=1 Tax=Colletotrichum chlorophyti TaxID=708187 RepID=A0A1Q8S1B0_9PEZI|nr:hypothetical protein CCHL11_10395 [Colletotrichum chlorophyti]
MTLESWVVVSHEPEGEEVQPSATAPHHDCWKTFEPSPVDDSDESNHKQECIFAGLLIPGHGEPIPHAAVGISSTNGSITFVGPQSQLPEWIALLTSIYVRYLLPGLWDCHTHFIGVTNVDFPDLLHTHPVAMGASIARGMHESLMTGFTSVRGVGSYAAEVAPLVEANLILGPHVFGAGAAIGIMGGSCDACTLPADFVYSRQGISSSGQHAWAGVTGLVITDGVEECRLAVRQQIRRGARCIKAVATGGVLSTTDDRKFRQYSGEELSILVQEASLQGRSVAVHAHGKDDTMAAIRAGAHTIEHTQLSTEATLTTRRQS